MSKHTERTLKLLRDQGYTAEVVERWLPIPKHPGGGKRKDFLGIIDIIAFNDYLTIGVQSCGADFRPHVKTIMDSKNTIKWLGCYGRQLELYAWRKLKRKRGGKAYTWKPRKAIFYLINNQIEWEEVKE